MSWMYVFGTASMKSIWQQRGQSWLMNRKYRRLWAKNVFFFFKDFTNLFCCVPGPSRLDFPPTPTKKKKKQKEKKHVYCLGCNTIRWIICMYPSCFPMFDQILEHFLPLFSSIAVLFICVHVAALMCATNVWVGHKVVLPLL